MSREDREAEKGLKSSLLRLLRDLRATPMFEALCEGGSAFYHSGGCPPVNIFTFFHRTPAWSVSNVP